MAWEIKKGDVLDGLRSVADDTVQCVVTSPPYWGLRDYGVDGQIGLESSPDEHIARLVEVFREVRRVLRPDGVCWVNYGSFYASGPLAARRDGERGMLRTEPQGSHVGGPACPRSDGESGESSSNRIAGTLQPRDGFEQQLSSEVQRTDGSHSPSEAPPTSACVSLGSTTPQSSPRHPVECSRSASIVGCQSAPSIALVDALESARKDASLGTLDTSALVRLLVDHIEGTEPSDLALLYSSIALRRFKQKDLVSMPFILAETLRLDGWYVRADVIWAKGNPMPESVTDRPTRAHEYVFMLTKSARYFYDAEAIREAVSGGAHRRRADGGVSPKQIATSDNGAHQQAGKGMSGNLDLSTRNARTVWTINPQPTPEAHFATFPEALAERCILAGSRRGDLVLDPFAGSGTTLLVAERLGRDSVGCELNPEYVAIAERRIRAADPMEPTEVAPGRTQKSLFSPQ